MALLVADPHPATFTAYTDTNSKVMFNHIFSCIEYIRNIILESEYYLYWIISLNIKQTWAKSEDALQTALSLIN